MTQNCKECGALVSPNSKVCKICGDKSKKREFRVINIGEMPVDSFDDFLVFDKKEK